MDFGRGRLCSGGGLSREKIVGKQDDWRPDQVAAFVPGARGWLALFEESVDGITKENGDAQAHRLGRRAFSTLWGMYIELSGVSKCTYMYVN